MYAKRKSYFRYLIGLALAWLVVFACQRPGLAQVADEVNQFPVNVSAEAFLGRPTRISADFKIFFPKDEKRYLPVSPSLAQLLSSPPEVVAKPGWSVRVLKTECRPQEITIALGQGTGLATGGRVECEIEITPDRSVKKGVHNLTLLFPVIDLAFEQLGVRATSKTVVQVKVAVWPSPEAKQEALRLAEEERKRREEAAEQVRREREERDVRARREQEEAVARLRREQEEAAERERYEVFKQFVKTVSPFLALATLIGMIVVLKRKWIWPDLKMKIAAGEHQQIRHVLLSSGDDELGTILQTTWARAWHGRRQRIKVETFVSEDIPEATKHGSRPIGNPLTQQKTGSTEYWAAHSTQPRTQPKSQLDLLISAGISAKPGTYLALILDQAVRITVSG